MAKIYFASDFHLGTPNKSASLARELKIIAWLESIRKDADKLYLVGDIFDFWFEYSTVVPKGYLRFISKLIELQNDGVEIEFFIGNHDMWMFDYFTEELGIPVHRAPIERTFNGKKFLIGHGDGLGPEDKKYKFLKRFFASKTCQWLFARLHPNLGIGIANKWSRSSRANTSGEDKYLGDEKEWLNIYCEEQIRANDFDFLVFGHRHLPIDNTLSNQKSRYINLGDWLQYDSYGVFDGNNFELKYYE